MDPHPRLLDVDEDVTEIDLLPAPLRHIPPPAKPERKVRAPIPPPLPILLKRKVDGEGARPLVNREPDSDELWLATLPPASRNVLEAARRPVAGWPIAPRLTYAIAQPVRSTSA